MSYLNNPNSIKAGPGIIITSSPGTGAQTITISASNNLDVTIRPITSSPATITNADDIVYVQLMPPAPAVINLPPGQGGRMFSIKDGSGLAGSTQPIAIVPNGNELIDGNTMAVIDSGWGSLTIVFNGVQWLIL